MYDELVKDLRNMSKMGVKYGMAAVKMQEAADTIEELSVLCASQSKDCSEAIEKYIDLWERQPHWIPVTERLPKEEKKAYWVCTDTGYQCECRWTDNPFGIGKTDEWHWNLFDVPQYQKVMAWMDLPEPYKPPKEE